MLLLTFPAPALATNCYVLAEREGAECVVVDPGIGVEDQLRDVLRQFDLTPVGAVITHGHLDHTGSSPAVCGQDLPCHIHAEDRYRLTDPFAQLSAPLRAMYEQQYGSASDWREPPHVVEVQDGEVVELAGLRLRAVHAPGHTEGSTLWVVDDVPQEIPAEVGVTSTAFTGDVLFAGTVGRTDLAGGSPQVMQQTLRDVVLALPDDTLVLPGHGPGTTMTQERATNPFLQGL